VHPAASEVILCPIPHAGPAPAGASVSILGDAEVRGGLLAWCLTRFVGHEAGKQAGVFRKKRRIGRGDHYLRHELVGFFYSTLLQKRQDP
jgi:hypothetical protein